jgi:cell volume regulation protein A
LQVPTGVSASSLATLSMLLFIGVVVAAIADRFRLPAMIPLLLTGLLIGSSPFNISILSTSSAASALTSVGFLAVLVILFEGGLGMNLEIMRRQARSVGLLASMGVLIFALLVAVIVHYFFSTWSWGVALLFGAIIAPTDPAVIFPLMRFVSVKRKVSTVIEAEAALNDATGLLLFSLVSGTIAGMSGAINLTGIFGNVVVKILELGLGSALIGLGVAFVMARIMERSPADVQVNVLSLVAALAVYIIGTSLGWSGPIAAVFCSIGLANSERFFRTKPLPVRRMGEFWAQIAFIVQIFVFILLGTLVNPTGLVGLGTAGLLIVLFSIFVARPASVFVSTLGDGSMNKKEKTLVSWAGIKGIVPAVLAASVVSSIGTASVNSAPTSGISPTQAYSIADLTFLTIIVVVLLQGGTISAVARRLGLTGEAHAEIDRLVAERELSRIALENLEKDHTEGKITNEIYKDLRIHYLNRLTESEEALYSERSKAEQTLMKLEETKRTIERQLQYLNEQRSKGLIDGEVYDELKERFQRDLTQISSEVEKTKKNTRLG